MQDLKLTAHEDCINQKTGTSNNFCWPCFKSLLRIWLVGSGAGWTGGILQGVAEAVLLSGSEKKS